MKRLLLILSALSVIIGCQTKKTDFEMSNISEKTIASTIVAIAEKTPEAEIKLMAKGVKQTAALWRASDGTEKEFTNFCTENYKNSPESRRELFDKLSVAFEQIFGTANQLSVLLKKPVQLKGGELTEIDYILGNYDPSSHTSDDLFVNKIAFITTLNFPNYTLAEKNELGKEWTRLEWAYARMGDLFENRIPAPLKQELSEVYGNADNYIAAYNIQMGHLLNDKGERLFPAEMSLLSHWNLRDEIKSNYANVPNANEKQEMIYKVMEHIVLQTIPKEVINNPEYDWAPYSNLCYKEGKEVSLKPEGSERYRQLLANFQIEKKLDPFNPQLPTGILRNFEGGMEVSAEEIEELFVTLISSPEVKEVGKLIESRLGRPLRPYDIWYDGFKSRSNISEDALTAKTKALYPNTASFEKDMPRMLRNMGFSTQDADDISSKIVVEDARGSGHAWGAVGRWEPARLRTRLIPGGMDYKGYNIAVHEFGHNVEQTLSLYYMDHYMLQGVPNTAFTEALAFVFQKRDLQLLGYTPAPKTPSSKDLTPEENTTLDIFWGSYEIMGVSLVDMYSWRWMYEHPNATPEELRDEVVKIARDVWNRYYAPILGTPDSPLLAIYSHMINSPMYLPNYPYGHIIEFQLEEHFATLKSEKEFANEIKRVFTLGTLTPNIWMQEAVGSPVSTEPLIKAVSKILSK